MSKRKGAALRDLLALVKPRAVEYTEARARLLDAAAAVAEMLGGSDASAINADLPKHAEHWDTRATGGLADLLAELYEANDAWQIAQCRRFAPNELDPEDR